MLEKSLEDSVVRVVTVLLDGVVLVFCVRRYAA